MGWKRELTLHEVSLCQAMGETIIFWNHVENAFRILLQRATHLGGPDGRIWSLIAHLTPVQLKDAMIAISHDHQEIRAEHLAHCAKVFDRERQYRNHYVHGPITFLTSENASHLLAHDVSAKGGSLKVKQAQISLEEINKFRDRLGVLQDYIGELLEDSRSLREGKSLADLAKPPIYDAIPLKKFSWWEMYERPPQ